MYDNEYLKKELYQDKDVQNMRSIKKNHLGSRKATKNRSSISKSIKQSEKMIVEG